MQQNANNNEEPTLGEDVRNIIGGVATIVLIVVPIILVRKLIKAVEEGETFKAIEDKLRF